MNSKNLRVIVAGTVATLSSAALADDASVLAFETGTIRPDGPRQGANGSNFFNIEGADYGNFASYGTCRWDLAAAKAQFDSAFGVGNWEVTAVTLKMTQANAAFTFDGPVDLYLSTDDVTDCKTTSSPLAWPFFDGSTPDLALANGGATLCEYNFVQVATGQVDEYTQAGGPNGAGEALALAADLKAELEAGGILTLVFVDAETFTAATYRGQIGAAELPPELVITAEGKGTACYPDCDSSGALNIDDFICFQTFFAIGDTYADCDSSGNLNIDDFICFQTFFALGC
jgi:hypothetical protein